MGKKVCSKCKEEKELSDYPIHGYKKNEEYVRIEKHSFIGI